MPDPVVQDHMRLFKAFLETPTRTGAVAPSSRHLAARMVEEMGLSEARTVVELGGGTGSLTRAVLAQLSPEALLLVFEVHPDLAAYLRRTFPRVTVVNDSGEHVGRYLAGSEAGLADAVLSGLPWATFSRGLQARILDAAVAALRPGGRFSTFAYVHAGWLPSARRLRRMLRERFRVVDTSPIVWRNLPPAFVYRCER